MPDVIVIGAGPAGCAAATVLAQEGHAVTLVDRPAGHRPALAESVPPSARRILRELGMEQAVAAAGLEPWLGNTVWWAGAPPRTETFALDATGYQVERLKFDAVLRDAAVRAGARLVTGIVRTVAGPLVTVEVEGRNAEIAAPWIIDCSGRSGVCAKPLRISAVAHRTVALAGIWSASSWPGKFDGHTLVASHDDGWAWSVPIASGRRHITVMVDPERSHLTRGASSREVYLSELGKVGPFAELLIDAQLDEGPWGADASLYDARAYARPGLLLAGDASTAIDPLSSFGVKKALTSGWRAGVVVHTILTEPGMQEVALAYYEDRERAVAATFRRQSTEFAKAVGGSHPFWQARVVDSNDDEDDVDPAALAKDPHVQATVRDLQSRPVVHLVVGDEAHIVRQPIIAGRRVVLEDHVVLPTWPNGVRYIRNVNVVQAMHLAVAHRDVGEVIDAVMRAQPGVGAPDVLGVLGTLLARGGLRHKV